MGAFWGIRGAFYWPICNKSLNFAKKCSFRAHFGKNDHQKRGYFLGKEYMFCVCMPSDIPWKEGKRDY
jgi:hypothetical protein